MCCEVMVDGVAIAKVEGHKRQRRSIAEKRRIVELAMQPSASIARIAREHGVNANMVHYWRKLYREGRLGENKTDSVRLLPVAVTRTVPSAELQSGTALSSTGSVVAPAAMAGAIYIEFPKIHLRVESGADPTLLRVVLETLQP
jgi:transposase